MEIWTEEENELRQLSNLIDYKGNSCLSCQWCSAEKNELFHTCGRHIQNFTVTSWCSYWTSKDDKNVKAYFDKKKKQLINKIKSK